MFGGSNKRENSEMTGFVHSLNQEMCRYWARRSVADKMGRQLHGEYPEFDLAVAEVTTSIH